MFPNNSVSRVLAVCVALSLAACASGPAGEGEVPAPVPVIDAGNVGGVDQPPPPPAQPSLTEADFLGQSPAMLDRLFGPPALTRVEGAGQFRRYDVGPCRIYAVVFPDEGGRAVVRSVTTGPAKAGDTAPPLSACTVTGS